MASYKNEELSNYQIEQLCMPILNSNYRKGKIYMLCLPPFLPYIGSTVQTLSKRISQHRTDARSYIKGLSTYKLDSHDLALRKGCKIYLLEDFPCSNRKELEKREGWYQINNPCVNKKVAGVIGFNFNKYYQDNKEKRLAYGREKVECELCKSIVRRDSSYEHKKSMKCQRLSRLQPERTYTEGGLA